MPRLHSALAALLAASSLAAVLDQENLPNTGLDTSTWTTGVLPPLADMWSINDFQIAAKNVMSLENYGPHTRGVASRSLIGIHSVLPHGRSRRDQ
jgi:hypothetical protein